MVVEILPEELENAKKLMREAKYEDALGTIKTFKKKSGITDEDKLSALIIEGWLYFNMLKIREVLRIGELAYPLSRKLGNLPRSIETLHFKTCSMMLGKYDDALESSNESEALIDRLEKQSNSELPRERAITSFGKSWIYMLKGDYNKALEFALLGRSYSKKIGGKFHSGRFSYIGLMNFRPEPNQLFGYIYLTRGEHDSALEHAIKSLEIQKNKNHSVFIAENLILIGTILSYKGDLDSSIKYCKQGLSIPEIAYAAKSNALLVLGRNYKIKGELDRALNYFEQGLTLHKEMGYKIMSSEAIWLNIGTIYLMKGDYENAVEYVERSLESSSVLYKHGSFFWLVSIYLDKKMPEETQVYLSKLKELAEKTEGALSFQYYHLAKALVLKASGRTRNRAEAEILLKQIIEREIIDINMYILSLVSLCDFLLEELENSNDPEVIDEINPVITRLLEIAEKQHSYSILAETNLLQGRLALIKLNLDDARQFLTTAQKIANENGLTLLAQKISHEHDSLLDELETWQSLKKTKTSMSKRMKLASIDGVLERMKGIRAIEPLESSAEQPILLLILAQGGVLLFSYAFSDDWKRDDDLFGSFLSAFSTFSDEFFSQELDRAKFGEDTLLLQPAGSFSICYLFQGQTYFAKQKLAKFAEAIQKEPAIWDTLEKFEKSSRVAELRDLPMIENLLTNIFQS